MNQLTKLFTVLLLFICTVSYAQQSEGINFFEGSWEEVLAEAQKTNKPIFMDAYASWCKPCKMMSKDVFPQANVGAYFNDKYVSVKIDMEKGEGIELAKKYGVRVYPTFLFINPEGEALHKSAGYRPANEFVQVGKDGIDENKQYYALEAKYEAGDKTPSVLYNYAMAMYGSDAYYQSGSVADEYLQQLDKKELKSQKTMDMVMTIPINYDGTAAQLLLNNRKKYVKAYTSEKVDNKFLGMMKSKVAMAAKNDDAKALRESTTFISENIPAKADEWNAKLSMSFYEQTDNWKEYANVASKYVENHAMDNAETLNSIAWVFYENVDDNAHLQKAVEWADRSIELEKNYYNTDTKAALHFKLGQYEEALEAAKVAITAAIEEEMEPKETRNLVTKITYDSGLGLDYILGNKEAFAQSLGDKEAAKTIKKLLHNAAYRAGQDKDMDGLQSTMALVNQYYPKKAESMNASLSLTYYENTDDWDQYVSTAMAYVEKEGGMDDWNLLNTIAWGFFENIEDKAHLAKALTWANRSIELEQNYYNTDTKAALLHKLGNNQEALTTAKLALELAAKDGIEAKETQELMKKLENLEP
ncbi:MAG: thioredoxin family protein [Chitinophagales bacterium]